MAREELYKLTDVVRRFRMKDGWVTALDHLSLNVFRGEWVAMVGRSGSGKTTLLQLMGGLDSPTSGSVCVEGRDLAKMSSGELTRFRHARIGFIFQSYHLFPELSAVENALLPALRWGEDRSAAERRAVEYLKAFGLWERLQHRPRELSGGEQQRVAIARALINNPDIILADEPTGNLDRVAANEIMEIIGNIRKQGGKTLVMVTHDQELAHRADRIITLQASRKPEAK